MKLVFMQKLDPIRKSEHCGRGEYESFTSGYVETTVAVDLDAFIEAFETSLPYRNSLRDESQQMPCIDISFSKGDRSPSYAITHAEFKRIFRREFGFRKEKDDN